MKNNIETYKCATKNCKRLSWIKEGLCNKCLFELGMKRLNEEEQLNKLNKPDKLNKIDKNQPSNGRKKTKNNGG